HRWRHRGRPAAVAHARPTGAGRRGWAAEAGVDRRELLAPAQAAAQRLDARTRPAAVQGDVLGPLALRNLFERGEDLLPQLSSGGDHVVGTGGGPADAQHRIALADQL